MGHDVREAREGARTIVCPYCSRRYRLPESLIGSGGARIRCPGCAGRYVLSLERAESSTSRAGPGVPSHEARVRPAESELERMADQVVATLDVETGGQLADAHERGRLFAEFGPPLLDAFDAYRRMAGADADPEPFRRALLRRCRVDLIGEIPESAAGC